jgi:hypothetical protein
VWIRSESLLNEDNANARSEVMLIEWGQLRLDADPEPGALVAQPLYEFGGYDLHRVRVPIKSWHDVVRGFELEWIVLPALLRRFLAATVSELLVMAALVPKRDRFWLCDGVDALNVQ